MFDDHYVCVAWRDNPHLQSGKISAQQLGALPQVVVEFERQRAPPVFQWVHGRLQAPLHPAITVSNYSVVPFLIVGTDRISLVHSRMARMYAKFAAA